MAGKLDDRIARLGAEIEAARARLAAREGFEDDEIGDILGSINDDFEAVTREEEAKAHAAYDRIESRLAELQPLLAALPR
jgi:hypothetical protein